MKTIYAADLFCGGGGTTTGMIKAFMSAGIKYELIGINHWQVAIDTMKINHPEVESFRATLESIDPCEKVPCGHLDFLWASPECTNHSKAKGGKPKSNQSRCQPEMLLSWIRKLVVKRLYVENVEEFRDWASKPLKTITTRNNHGLLTPFLVKFNGSEKGALSA